MADVASSIVYVLHQEDARMAGTVTNDPRDSGGRTRWGLAERWHPELTPTGYYDTMSKEESLSTAITVYSSEYAKPLMLASVKVQQLSNALLSFAINEGVISSIKVLQAALGFSAKNQDGQFGPVTLEAVNSMSSILILLDKKQTAHYESIGGPFLHGWLNRVHQDCETA